MSAIPISERQRWVGASEVSTLLGVNRFQSRDHLLLLKAGLAGVDDISKKSQVIFGHRLEPFVLTWAEVDFPAYTVSSKCTEYWPHPMVQGLGASPDALGTHYNETTRGVIEAKTTGTNRWIPPGCPAPEGWVLQVLCQIACSDGYLKPGEPRFEWGAIFCLACGHDFRCWHVPRDDTVIARIESETVKFWEEVRELRRLEGLE